AARAAPGPAAPQRPRADRAGTAAGPPSAPERPALDELGRFRSAEHRRKSRRRLRTAEQRGRVALHDAAPKGPPIERADRPDASRDRRARVTEGRLLGEEPTKQLEVRRVERPFRALEERGELREIAPVRLDRV